MIFAVCVLGGLLGMITHKDFTSVQKLLFGVIILSVVLSPAVEMVENLNVDSLLEIFDASVEMPEYSYESVAEDAFAKGIATSVAQEFSLKTENIRIKLYGFDFEKMRAEKIRIVLSGSAAMSDYRAVADYVNKMNIGECEVEIEIG